jgi:hypothetical protein
MILSQNSPSFWANKEQVVTVAMNPRQLGCISAFLMAVARLV